MLQPSWLAFILPETPCKILEKKDSHHSVTPVHQPSLSHTCRSVITSSHLPISPENYRIHHPWRCAHWYNQHRLAWDVCALVHSGSTSLGGVHSGLASLGGMLNGIIRIDHPGRCAQWYNQDQLSWDVSTLVHSALTSLGSVFTCTVRSDQPGMYVHWYTQDRPA